jgi:uncharacterized protein YdhG (YjbR/CyaY superfamily)
MQSSAQNLQEYYDALPEDRQAAMRTLRKVINKNIPKGFSEELSYGMPGWVVPHKIFPAGYHCDPKLPLPFLAIASQKNFISVYHMGLYADEKILKWFTDAYAKLDAKLKLGKLDIGKSCIRFKNPEKIPFDLIGELMGKMTVKDWVGLYEARVKR